MPFLQSHPIRRFPPTPPEYFDDDLHGTAQPFPPATSSSPLHCSSDPLTTTMGLYHGSLRTNSPAPVPHSFTLPHRPFAAPMEPPNITQWRALPPPLQPLQIPRDHTIDMECRKLRKEEKVGGVAAHLDYEIDEMVNFVAISIHQILDHYFEQHRLSFELAGYNRECFLCLHQTARQECRKFIAQVLSSTRLPSSTIFHALFILNRQMTWYTPWDSFMDSKALLGKLTTALMLGSKFLDDNTFQNQSWSEVSGIVIGELNAQEIKWLVDMDWDLHINAENMEGFSIWLRRWQMSQQKSTHPSPSQSFQAPSEGRPYSGPMSPYSSQFDARDHHVGDVQGYHWAPYQWHGHYSPPSAPETGPATPQDPFFSGYTTPSIGPCLYQMPMPGRSQFTMTPPWHPQPYAGEWENCKGSSCACRYCWSRQASMGC